MVVTLPGISMPVSDRQSEKAASPIVVTLSAIPMLSSDSQPEKAESPIVFVP